MKCSKKLIALIIVFVLVLSFSSVASASSGPYSYEIPGYTHHGDIETVSVADIEHYSPTPDNIWYKFKQKAYYFDQSQFVSSHLSGLMQEYRSLGLLSSLIVPATEDVLPIPASYTDGLYAVLYTYQHASGSWYVKLNDLITYSGTFVNAPRGYNISLYMKHRLYKEDFYAE